MPLKPLSDRGFISLTRKSYPLGDAENLRGNTTPTLKNLVKCGNDGKGKMGKKKKVSSLTLNGIEMYSVSERRSKRICRRRNEQVAEQCCMERGDSKTRLPQHGR